MNGLNLKAANIKFLNLKKGNLIYKKDEISISSPNIIDKSIIIYQLSDSGSSKPSGSNTVLDSEDYYLLDSDGLFLDTAD